MHRTINSMLMLATLAAAFALYAIKYDTRKLETGVQAQERALDKARGDVSVLTAERAHLARPERLEPLARLQGLEPIAPGQYVRLQAGPEVEADPPASDIQPGRPAAIPNPSR
jgi:cell division protein FtsL